MPGMYILFNFFKTRIFMIGKDNAIDTNPTGVSVSLSICVNPDGETATVYKPEIADGDLTCMNREEAGLLVKALRNAMELEKAMDAYFDGGKKED